MPIFSVVQEAWERHRLRESSPRPSTVLRRDGGDPCNQCVSCLEITSGASVDVQEIDGASNRGIDEIRELRENIRYMPSSSRYRVYIIDEVHMLTLPAFNALLKTLEEPPAHVKFIFATTEAHKVPATILSRCQRFDFKRIARGPIIQHLERITDPGGNFGHTLCPVSHCKEVGRKHAGCGESPGSGDRLHGTLGGRPVCG